MSYRNLTAEEIRQLQSQACFASDWTKVLVAERFTPGHVFSTRFFGDVRLGVFESEFELAGGICKHAGLYHTVLSNVEIGDNCCIENVKNYIANYKIGHDTFIENVDIILTDGVSSFGNGVEVAVLNETGGREVMIYDRLSAHEAYMMALYRHKPELITRMREIIGAYTESISSATGTIGPHCTIADSGYIKNVKISEYTKIEGASRLKNGSINGNATAPVHIGVNVIGDDFIICSGSSVEDGVTFSRCFIGQSCKLGHGYSASDSLFFANCQGENGEACAIFAGPYTVTHHKSTLLIAGMFSFMNAGSGSNQSNHMYKLGPIHQGIMERGAKTASDSYILWPAKIGAFSLVMGRHVAHQDTSNLPFSYIIEQKGTTYIVPGANLKSVGTIRDSKKWPKRDARKDPEKLDLVNFNLLSPYTMQKVLHGIGILQGLQAASGKLSEEYAYQSGIIKRSALENGLRYYNLVLDKFLGNSIISRIQKSGAKTFADLQAAFAPDSETGTGNWVDVAGLLAPQDSIKILIREIIAGTVNSTEEISQRLADLHENYYDYEWNWAYGAIRDHYGIDLCNVSPETLHGLLRRWRDSVVSMDEMLYDDAHKEFSLSFMTGFGVDGGQTTMRRDFEQVRGSSFETDPFVMSIKDHITAKTALYNAVTSQLDNLK